MPIDTSKWSAYLKYLITKKHQLTNNVIDTINHTIIDMSSHMNPNPHEMTFEQHQLFAESASERAYQAVLNTLISWGNVFTPAEKLTWQHVIYQLNNNPNQNHNLRYLIKVATTDCLMFDTYLSTKNYEKYIQTHPAGVHMDKQDYIALNVETVFNLCHYLEDQSLKIIERKSSNA